MSTTLKVIATDVVLLTRGVIGTIIATSFLIGCIGAASFISYMALREPAHAVEYLNAILSLQAISMSDSTRLIATFVNWAVLTGMAIYLLFSVSRLYRVSVVDRAHLAQLQHEARNTIRQRQTKRLQDETAEQHQEAVNS